MVTVVGPHDPKWKEAFFRQEAAICAALHGSVMELHHIGSTAIPGILAKPIIDLLGVVRDLDEIDAQTSALEALGYQAMGAYGIEGRRYFRKINCEGRRTHHLHTFEKGSPQVERHLAFRDYLTANPEIAAEYSALKERLTKGNNPSWDRYMDAKDPFVRTTEQDAIFWYRQNQPG